MLYFLLALVFSKCHIFTVWQTITLFLCPCRNWASIPHFILITYYIIVVKIYYWIVLMEKFLKCVARKAFLFSPWRRSCRLSHPSHASIIKIVGSQAPPSDKDYGTQLLKGCKHKVKTASVSIVGTLVNVHHSFITMQVSSWSIRTQHKYFCWVL